jgi:hypothetical protein
MRILDFLQFLLDAFTPDWEALAMFWPELLTFIAVVVFLTFGIACLGELLEKLSAKVNSYSYRKPRGKVSHSCRTDPKNRRLQAQLLDLLRGDVVTARGLLSQQRRKHPGKSDNWYLEKVIWDLERDRH